MYIDLYKIVLVQRLISFLITYFFSTLRPADCAHFGSVCTKIGMIQRRLAWPPCKDDMQIHEPFHIKKKFPAGFRVLSRTGPVKLLSASSVPNHLVLNRRLLEHVNK